MASQTSASNIQIVPLDFDRVRADLKRYLQAQTEFKDYNFEGSALSLLLDILAYDAYYHGWYTNFAVNEVFLQTAQLRSSVVAAARQVGYIPRSTTGSTAEVNITIGNIDPLEGVVTLPKYSKFVSTISGETFTFYTLDDIVVYPRTFENSVIPPYKQITLQGVKLREGTLLTQSYTIDSTLYSDTGTKLRVFNQNVDTSTISVTINPTSSNDTAFVYSKATSAVTINPTSNVYFLFETSTGDYEIQFGDNQLGRNLNIGQRVNIQYLNSKGPASTGASTFTYVGNALGAVSQTSNVSIVLNNVNIPAYGGADRESLDSIKRLAPNIYQTQGRIVTPDDARTILLSEVNGIESLTLWGGEDNDPPVYGKMFVCMKPYNGNAFGPTQKQNIINTILRPKALPTLSFEAVDPDYIYLVVNSEIRYSPAATSLSVRELQQQIINAIDAYAVQNLGQFGSYFRYSQLSKVIDTAEVGIQSNMSTILLEKKLRVTPGAIGYVVRFANPLFQPSLVSQIGGSNNTYVTVTSKVEGQTFSHIDEFGINQRFCWLQNEGTAIHVYKSDVNNVITKVKSNVGQLNFDDGTIIFTNFTPRRISSSLINELRIQAIPLNSDVIPNRNQLILLPIQNVRLTFVDDLLSRRNTTVGRSSAPLQSGFSSFGV